MKPLLALVLIMLGIPVAVSAQTTTIINLRNVTKGGQNGTFVDAVRNNFEPAAVMQTLLEQYATNALANAQAARDAALARATAAEARTAELQAIFDQAKALVQAGATTQQIVQKLNQDARARELEQLQKARDDAQRAYDAAVAAENP